jgi:LuxR family transcriptional regulator, maltose regulon positive regulatory protein
MDPDLVEPAEDAVADSHPGWRYLKEGRWDRARAAFEAALPRSESPEDLEGLSWAAWWLDDAEAVFRSRERAFLLYRKEGRPVAAARMAIWLAVDHLDFRGAGAVARGWLRRAGRLLEDLDPGPEHGWLAFHRGYLSHLRGDTRSAVQEAVRAAELGRATEVPDLEMLGLGLHGSVLVARGEVEEGMALLDEATAAALSGEATLPIAGAWTCCLLVSSCEQVRDYPRAHQWCREIEAFARRYGSRYMLGFCRTHYGLVYISAGRWDEAEEALAEGADAYRRSRPAYLPGTLVALAELRRRQGRDEEAEGLLDETGAGTAALLCRARLALDRGEALRADELTARALRKEERLPLVERAPGLELQVWSRTARGDLPGAEDALDELREVARVVGTPLLIAASELAAGILAAAAGDYEAARPLLEDACDRYRTARAPFEAARARMELARILDALERRDAALEEARTALDTLVELGARGEARRARRLLEELEKPDDEAGAPTSLPQLTRREREVLRQVAQGLTNREVADRLSISEHTVHRHVANILRKLDLSTRTAAATRAAQAGLLDD